MPAAAASVGVADHCGWAVLVTVGAGGRVLDRRQVDLVDEGLPKLPHHHDAQGLPLEEAVALIERVRASAERNAALALEALEPLAPAVTCPRKRDGWDCQTSTSTSTSTRTRTRGRDVGDRQT